MCKKNFFAGISLAVQHNSGSSLTQVIRFYYLNERFNYIFNEMIYNFSTQILANNSFVYTMF